MVLEERYAGGGMNTIAAEIKKAQALRPVLFC